MENRTLRLQIAKVVIMGLLLGIEGIINGYAQNFTVGDLNYSVNEDEISVTVRGHVNGTSASGVLSIPETVTNDGVSYSVTGIRNQAFMGCSGLTDSLIIPNSITKIGEYAFKNCIGFTGALTIGTAVNRIEKEAFANTGFTTVNFNPTNCTKMGYYREDGDWYGSPVFKDCPTITTLNIAENVTNIPTYAFESCSGLVGDLTIPNSVTSIGYGAFYGCSGFDGVLTIGTSVTYIGGEAFYYCRNFTEVQYNATSCGDGREGTDVFSYNLNNTSLIIGNNVIRIPSFIFGSARFSGNLVIPNSVRMIGNWAFSGCTTFSGTLIIGTSVQSIGYLAFARCGFDEIHYNAISCSDITPIYNYLGHRPPFEGCDFELVIGEGVTRIPSNMFRDQYYGGILSGNIIIPSSVTTIGDYAFSGNSRVASITVQRGTPPYAGTSAFSAIDTSIPCYVPYGSTAAYQTAPGWSSFTNYQEMPPVNTTQTVELSAGWNWFSPNVEITLEDLQDALVDALPNANAIMIKSKNGITTYNGDTWRGQLDSLDVTQMYRISVGTACEITLEGIPIIPAEHPVTIHNGVNWIGFPLSENMTLNDAFAGFVVAGDMVKSKNGVATYNGTDWRGSLDTLESGQGYIYKSIVQEDRIFTFPVSTK